MTNWLNMCFPACSPRDIQWSKINDTLPERAEISGPTLQISRLSQTHNGTYLCKAQNNYGRAADHYTLLVYGEYNGSHKLMRCYFSLSVLFFFFLGEIADIPELFNVRWIFCSYFVSLWFTTHQGSPAGGTVRLNEWNSWFHNNVNDSSLCHFETLIYPFPSPSLLLRRSEIFYIGDVVA